MPLFEYRCQTCGHQFETLVSSASRTRPPCPECDGQDVEKLYSAFGVGRQGSRTGAPPIRFSGG
jgi:putative FmdB family regulatory protein